jgi:surfactin synthase thioesterase subunit
VICIQCVAVTKVVKILDKNLHGSLQLMIGQPVTLAGYSEGAKVADTVIEAFKRMGYLCDGRPTPRTHDYQ